MSQAEILAALAPAAQRHLDPSAPLAARSLAARGMVPLPPRDLVSVLAGLLLDADPRLVQEATVTVASLPERLLLGALSAGLPPPVLGALVSVLGPREAILQQLVLSRETPDAALASLAPSASLAIAELLAADQSRCLRCEALVRGLHQNAALSRASLDRLVDFLVRGGQIYDDLATFSESLARLTSAELLQAVATVVLPAEVLGLVEARGVEVTAVAAVAVAAPAADEGGAAVADAEEELEPERISIQKIISGLSPAQKVALAMKGNRDARSILVRNTNRVVAVAAIRNPGTTEQEIVVAAKNRAINDEVIRIIAMSREMTRSYNVRLALVNHPKTPLSVALRFLGGLRPTDVKAVAKSRGIASGIIAQAKSMMKEKSGG